MTPVWVRGLGHKPGAQHSVFTLSGLGWNLLESWDQACSGTSHWDSSINSALPYW